MRIPNRRVDNFYIWQVETYGETTLDGNLPAEVIRYRPQPCTPAGDVVGTFPTAIQADKFLDSIAGLSLDAARRAFEEVRKAISA